jgi:putative MATE family efflux protein
MTAQDMTEGSIWRKLTAFSVPLLIGNIVQQMYSAADTIVVGRFVGDSALAAVGASFPILNLLLILFMGAATGAGVMVSQYFGAKDRDQLSKTVGTTITLMFIISVMIMIIGPLITRPLLRLLNTPEDVLDPCADYLNILFIGIAGIAYYNGISGILRSMGDSVMPLLFLCITCALNVAMDIWFVAGFGWGVAGAAWATVIAQWISSVLCFVRLARMKDVLDVNWSLIRINKHLTGQITKLGLPAAFTQMIFSLSQIIVQSLVNSFGTIVIACSTIVMRVDGFAMMPNFTFNMVMATFVGQNVGAGKMERVDMGTRSGLKMGLSVSTMLVAAILIFGKSLMGVFTNTEELINMSYRMMCILSFGYMSMAVTQILSGTMRGAGDTMTPMWISLITAVIIRMPLAYLLAWLTRSEDYPVGRSEIIFISLLAAWILGAFITLFFYRKGKWREKGIVKHASETVAFDA